MKWGIISFAGSQNPVVAFNAAFPTASLNLQISLTNTAATVPAAWRITTFTSTGFTANVQATGNSNLYWFAIGN